MRKIIFSFGEKFFKERELAEAVLDKLSRVLKLKKAYVEVFLIKGDYTVRSLEPPPDFPRPDLRGFKNLGEVYLCPDFIKDQARRAKGSYKVYLVWMLVHGFLHLLGYDHRRENAKIRMERKEKELIKSFLEQ